MTIYIYQYKNVLLIKAHRFNGYLPPPYCTTQYYIICTLYLYISCKMTYFPLQ